MCGIAGTVYKKNYLPGIMVEVEELVELFSEVKLGKATCLEFLDLAWKYKSNVNFIRYCKDKLEAVKLKSLLNSVYVYSERLKSELRLIDKSQSLTDYKKTVKDWEALLDAHWFFSSEIQKTKDTLHEAMAMNMFQSFHD